MIQLHYSAAKCKKSMGSSSDLASILTRSEDGSIDLEDPPLLSAIRTDPILADTRLIAEPWDAAGAYQLGTGFRECFGINGTASFEMMCAGLCAVTLAWCQS